MVRRAEGLLTQAMHEAICSSNPTAFYLPGFPVTQLGAKVPRLEPSRAVPAPFSRVSAAALRDHRRFLIGRLGPSHSPPPSLPLSPIGCGAVVRMRGTRRRAGPGVTRRAGGIMAREGLGGTAVQAGRPAAEPARAMSSIASYESLVHAVSGAVVSERVGACRAAAGGAGWGKGASPPPLVMTGPRPRGLVGGVCPGQRGGRAGGAAGPAG